MRCPDCGARNAPTATWCTQCYRRFDTPSEPASPPAYPPPPGAAAVAGDALAAPDEDPSGADPSGSDPSSARSDPATVPSEPTVVWADPEQPPADAEDVVDTGRDVRTRGGEVEWRCAVCDRWNSLVEQACTACASPRQGFGEPGGRTAAPQVSGTSTVLVASVLLPGLGHVLLGRVGTGIARMLLFLLWALGSVGLSRGASGVSTLAPALVLLLGAVLVWVGTLLDTRLLLASDSREVLTSRVLLWLVVGVTMALVAALLLAAVGGVA